MLCVGIITNTAAKFQFSDGTPVLSTDPASVIIRLGLLPLGHIQLVMLHYEHSEYSPFNTRLLPVTHGITSSCQSNHFLYFELSNELNFFCRRC